MCRNHCCVQPATPEQAFVLTLTRFKITVCALILVVVAHLAYNAFTSVVSIGTLAWTMLYVFVLNLAIRGANTKNVKLLRFYWIFQLINLLVVLIAMIAGLSIFAYMQYKQGAHPQQVNDGTNHHSNRSIVDLTVVNAQQTMMHESPLKSISVELSFRTMMITSVIFLVIVFVKTKSIVLARQMIGLIEVIEEENLEAAAELTDCCEKSAAAAATPLTPSGVYAPETAAIFVMIPHDASYPGQLMPIYVDKAAQQ